MDIQDQELEDALTEAMRVLVSVMARRKRRKDLLAKAAAKAKASETTQPPVPA
ncbi:hypothetical protein [Roseococcus pinisoli]|uniref:Uncharacterized protein n=1 Tax=Roseococcus pinisoli TaxID=2835040 RepID=A0ABS5QD48_9PROT|nr:hypothetical protein [Roseococcus pinisoli]MBS7811196.1 hypothetical protein [Roseococcus pinisoli]